MATPAADTRKREIALIAARLFRERGYRETTIRDIAAAVGIKSASLYYHFANKDAILYSIAHDLMLDFVADVTPLLDRGNADPEGAVASAAAAHLRFDASRRDEVLVSAHERSSLPSHLRQDVNRLRAQHRRALREVIERGAEMGVFVVDDTKVATNAVLDLLSGVKEWNHRTSAAQLEQIVRLYQGFALALLKHGAENYPPLDAEGDSQPASLATRP